MERVKEDIIFLDKVLSIKKPQELYRNYFCWLYPFTNENINGYFKNIKFENKSVLTIVSSGDHILNSFLLGAEKIDAFDSNPLAKYYTELKIAAIKELSFKEFLSFFYNKKIFRISPDYLNKKTYLRIRSNLDDNCKIFWDYLFKKYSTKNIANSYLFSADFLNLKGLLKANTYMNEENYLKLRVLLEDKKVTYYNMDLENIVNINKTYDIILLSNVPAFLENIFKVEGLKKLKNIIKTLTHAKSKVVLSYMYYNLLGLPVKEDSIYNNKKLRDYFSEEEYEYMFFESSDTLHTDNVLKKIFPKNDMIFVSKEKEEV